VSKLALIDKARTSGGYEQTAFGKFQPSNDSKILLTAKVARVSIGTLP
jgi:hypothetical protein